MVQTLRQVWQAHYERDDRRLRGRMIAELPPSGDRLQSPCDPEMHYGLKRQFGGSGDLGRRSPRPATRMRLTWSPMWRPARNADGSPRICAQLSRSDCGACAARALCTRTRTPRRHLYFHPREQHEAPTAARARMSDPAWTQRLEVRAGMEGTLSQGMRRSRTIGLARTKLQQVRLATAINVSRIVNWIDGPPRAKTRVAPFAARASAA